ncbi:MAG TPA: hypothetical protein VM054_00735 [bacterium]|nr:hypothetical protein [bacterium]
MTEKEFPENHWEEMKRLMERGGPRAVIEFVAGFPDDLERRKLYAFCNQAFSMRDWNGKNFDGLVEVVEEGIAEGLRQAAAAGDAETRDKCTDYANMMSYNLSANLAECWPGDEEPRERRHFEKGLELARRCVAWRGELKKAAGPFSMAHWACGMHALSLGNATAAREDFEKSLDYAVKNARESGAVAECASGGDFSVVLGHGYLGLARMAAGDAVGREIYDNAVDAFQATVEDFPEKKDDARFGLDQLRWVESRVLGRLSG